jgi:flavin reductase (DIM6/NTAB) family NADH-FMN oxidoreductase RutF
MDSVQPKAGASLTKEHFRRVMGQFATGVTVVTTRLGDEVHGLTANAVCSVSLKPLLVLVCVDHAADTHPLLERSGVFAVNILSHEQEDLSRLFAGPTEEKAGRLEAMGYRTAVTGAPIIDGCLAYLDCRVVAAYPGGDHTIFVGQVEEAEIGEEGAPLIFFRGGYTTVRGEDRAAHDSTDPP